MLKRLILSGMLVASTGAVASETINYTYDARGRLVRVQRSGSVNNNVTANYTYDNTNNRIGRTVTGAP